MIEFGGIAAMAFRPILAFILVRSSSRQLASF
jgi:hypothetical protein